MPYHYDEDKKKKRRVVETDPAKKAWKALQSGGLDPVPFDDDFDVYEAKKHLKEEVKGMGPEGKRFLKDKLSGKKYEGKLKPKFKKDLLKELEGMSSKGKSYVKKELGDTDQHGRSYKDYLGEKLSNLEGDFKRQDRSKLKSLKKGVAEEANKKLKFKGPDFLKPAGWDDMSEKKREASKKMMVGALSDIGQSIGKGFSDKDVKSYVKKEKGDVKMRGTPEHYKKWMRKERGQAYKELVDKWKKSNPEGKDPHGEVQAWNKKAQFLNKFLEGAKEGSIDDFKKSQTVKRQVDKDSKKILEMKKAFEKEKGDSKNWIQDAVKKPGALRDTAKRMGLIKGDELLSSKDLDELKSKAKKSGNALLMRRVNLAKTFKKMKK